MWLTDTLSVSEEWSHSTSSPSFHTFKKRCCWWLKKINADKICPYNMRKRYLVWIFTTRETSASSAIHWNIVSNCHFPFFIAETSAFTNSDVIIFCCRAKKCFKNYIFFCLTYPWTFSGSPHLANGACPFGITGNRMCLPRHWAVWTEPGTNTWLLLRQNARQNVFNWVLCSHFHQFLQKSAIPKKIVPVGW